MLCAVRILVGLGPVRDFEREQGDQASQEFARGLDVALLPKTNRFVADAELPGEVDAPEPALLATSPGLPGESVEFGGTRVLIAGSLDAVPWASARDGAATVSAERDDAARARVIKV